eukprot:scaffold27594_cov48-Attheya_sp.AAC.6
MKIVSSHRDDDGQCLARVSVVCAVYGFRFQHDRSEVLRGIRFNRHASLDHTRKILDFFRGFENANRWEDDESRVSNNSSKLASAR